MFAGPKRTFEDFKRQLRPQILPAFEELRTFCLLLANTVEDVRAHRIVFGKSLTFRWFADMEPDADSIIIKIQRDRKEPFKTITILHDQNLDEIKSQIKEAHEKIR
jgi:hypothetical protein